MHDDFSQRAGLYKLQRAKIETRQRRLVLPDSRYVQFRRTYRNDPVAFFHDCLIWPEGQGSNEYQDDIARRLVEEKRLAVRGMHGMGKTALLAMVVHWFALTRDGESDWKAPTTASVWRQLTKYLWPEIHKWSRRINWERVGRAPYNDRTELQTLNLSLSTGEAFAVASSDPGHIEGAHADSLLYVFDEAKIIPGATFDAAEGAFSGAGADTGIEAFAIAASTPGEPVGRFHDIHKRKPGFQDWGVRHVKLGEAIKAGRVSKEWVQNRVKQWGKKSAIFQNKVLGNFADSDENALIPLSWIEESNELWEAVEGMPYEGEESSYGLDPARFGDDQTAFCKLTGDILEWIRYTHRADTMETAGNVAAELGGDYESAIGIDSNGLGAGVYDRLAELGYNVTSFNVMEATDLTDSTGLNTFNNLRSAILWALREMLDPQNPNRLRLPADDDLTADLTTPTWGYTSRGSIIVEPKDKMKARLGRSPDGGDAVALAVYASSPQVWSASL